MVNSKTKSIRKRADYLNLKSTGRKVVPAPWVLLNYKINSQGDFRLGITVTSKVGNAVTRNKLKRWCKEYFINILSPDKKIEIDVNVVFKPMPNEFYKKLSFSEFTKTIEKGLQKIRSSS